MRPQFVENFRANAAVRRASRFLKFIEGVPRPLRIVDLGGAAAMWRRWGISESDGLEVTLINNHHIDKTHRNEELLGGFMREQQKDVLKVTSHELGQYDVVFSNSTLEHLGSRSEQMKVAETIARCGRPYFIQVPNKYCIVDPHFPHPLAPFFGVLPKQVQAKMLTLHRLGSGAKSEDYTSAMRRLSFYNPLGHEDLTRLFPHARIEVEWNFGMPMSLLALGETEREGSGKRSLDR